MIRIHNSVALLDCKQLQTGATVAEPRGEPGSVPPLEISCPPLTPLSAFVRNLKELSNTCIIHYLDLQNSLKLFKIVELFFKQDEN